MPATCPMLLVLTFAKKVNESMTMTAQEPMKALPMAHGYPALELAALLAFRVERLLMARPRQPLERRTTAASIELLARTVGATEVARRRTTRSSPIVCPRIRKKM